MANQRDGLARVSCHRNRPRSDKPANHCDGRATPPTIPASASQRAHQVRPTKGDPANAKVGEPTQRQVSPRHREPPFTRRHAPPEGASIARTLRPTLGRRSSKFRAPDKIRLQEDPWRSPNG